MNGQYLINEALKRAPDFVIQREDKPYLKRWWMIPRNDVMNVYLHHITADDFDVALHDHPWDNTTIVLRGRYLEIMPGTQLWRREGDVIHRPAEWKHRLVVGGGEAWTLFITGPWKRTWGFQCGERWVPWQEFVDPNDSGKIGKGCGE